MSEDGMPEPIDIAWNEASYTEQERSLARATGVSVSTIHTSFLSMALERVLWVQTMLSPSVKVVSNMGRENSNLIQVLLSEKEALALISVLEGKEKK